MKKKNWKERKEFGGVVYARLTVVLAVVTRFVQLTDNLLYKREEAEQMAWEALQTLRMNPGLVRAYTSFIALAHSRGIYRSYRALLAAYLYSFGTPQRSQYRIARACNVSEVACRQARKACKDSFVFEDMN